MTGRHMRANGSFAPDPEDAEEPSPPFPAARLGSKAEINPKLLRAQRLVIFPPLNAPRRQIRDLAMKFARGTDEQEMRLTYLGRDKRVMQVPLGTERLHSILEGYPTRGSNNYPRQKHISGFHWFGNHAALVPFESLLEQSWLRWAEWTNSAVTVASQPMLITGTYGTVRFAHTPDFLARRPNSSYAVVNVKPAGEVARPEINAQFAALTECLAAVGIQHEVWSEPDPQADANLKWFSRVRNSETVSADAVRSAKALFVDGDTYGSLDEKLWQAGHELHSRPAIDHLLWSRYLAIEMDYPFDLATKLYRPERRARG